MYPLHMCTINEDHLMYGSQDKRHDRQNFLSFWTIFCPLNPYRTENQNFKKMKKTPGDINILQMCTVNDDHIWLLRYGAQWKEFFVILDHVLFFHPSNNLKNQNFEKK